MNELKQSRTVLTDMIRKNISCIITVSFFPLLFSVPNWVVRQSKWRLLVYDGFALCIRSLWMEHNIPFIHHILLEVKQCWIKNLYYNVADNLHSSNNVQFCIIRRTVNEHCHMSSSASVQNEMKVTWIIGPELCELDGCLMGL